MHHEPTMEKEFSEIRPGHGLIAFTLFSAFALGANLAVAIHELGHVLGGWLGGGQVTEFVLRPFDFSHVDMDTTGMPAWGLMLYSGGGILFGVLLAWPLLLACRWVPCGSVAWLILFTTAAIAFGKNGVLLLQSVVTGRGDPAGVLTFGQMGYGIPPPLTRFLFALIAIPVLAVFVSLLLQLLRILGPGPEDSYVRWVTTVEGGFLSYFFLMVGHTAFFGDRELLWRQLPSFYLPFMLLFALLVLAAATWVFWTTGKTSQAPSPATHLNLGKAVSLFGLACAVIGGELAFWGP